MKPLYLRMRPVLTPASLAFIPGALGALLLVMMRIADAQAAPATSASPSPGLSPAPAHAPANPAATAAPTAPQPATPASASPTPRALGLHARTNASLTYVGQTSSGPGVVGPESAGFINGSPLSPNTPYDLFSSAPQVNGDSGIGQVITTANFATRAFDVDLTGGLGSSHGSVTTASYWSENLLPTINPHLGSQALPYGVVFPTHPGGDAATATRLSILGGGVGTADGNIVLRGGWLDLAQTDRFVFAQPALTNVNPAIAFAPAETLAGGIAGLDTWQPYANALPLHGIDVVAKRKTATLELTNAALPSLPGESARLSAASLVFDRGEGTRFSGEAIHVVTAGAPFTTTVPFGLDPAFGSYPQGVLPTSRLSGQRQTLAGLRAAFHVLPALGVDSIIEVGRAWYDAAPVARPGTSAPGGYYHAELLQTRGRATAALDFYRMEARYATMILPYGVPENQWSVAFAWPGQWLKSNYQLIDNSVLGVNRQGYRLRYFVDKGPLEIHLEYTDVHQIEAETVTSSQQSGFIDGYFLPQTPGAATFGRQRRTALWAAWHPRIGDISLDVVDDTEFRPFLAAHPEDRVSYEVPQAIVTFSRHLSPNVVAATGIGRYAMNGAFAEPVDFAQRLFFAGVEAVQTPRSSILLTFRRTAFGGLTTYPFGPNSPDFTASTLIVEQRLRL